MDKQPSKKEILEQIKKLQEDNHSDNIELAKIRAERKNEKKEPLKEKIQNITPKTKETLNRHRKDLLGVAGIEEKKPTTEIQNEEEKKIVDNTQLTEEEKEDIIEETRMKEYLKNKKIKIEDKKPVIEIQNDDEKKILDNPQLTEEEKSELIEDMRMKNKYFKNKDAEDLEDEEKETTKEEKKNERKLDTQKLVEKINEQIAEKEKASGVLFTPEEKQALAQEMFLKAKEDFQKETIESSGRLKRAYIKTEKWWSVDLEKTHWKRIAKVAMSTAFIGSATLLSGSLLGIAPTGSIATKLLSRVGIATGLNMVMTSKFSPKILGAFKKENEGKDGESKLKKLFTAQNIMTVLGLGASFALTGGLIVPAIGAGGIALRKISNAYFEKKIKEAEEKLEQLSEKDKTEKLNDNFDINTFVQNLEKIGQEHDTAIETLKKYRRYKGLATGALTIGVGLGTMAALHHNTEVKTDEVKHENEVKHDTEDLKHQTELKHQQELKQQDDLRKQIEEQYKIKDITIHEGEGIEHSFIRQIEHNHDLAKELGFKGDINDVKALHEFAGREAHIIAIKEGYVNSAGHEVRITEADKIAPEIKIENGHVVVQEGTIVDGKLETSAIHHEGDKFGEDINKYEHVYTQPHHEVGAISDSEQDHIDAPEQSNHLNDQINAQAIADLKAATEPHNYTDSLHAPNQTEHIKTEFEDNSKHPITEINPYHLSGEDLEQVNKLHNTNIDNIVHGQSLGQSSSGANIQKIESTLNEGHADAMMGIEKSSVDTIYQPLHSYIHRLHEITDLKPRSETLTQPAETNIEYIHRAEMKVVEMHKLEEIEPSHVLPFLAQEKEIIFPKNEHFPLITESGKTHFFYDNSGSPRGFNVSDIKMEGFRDNVIFKDDFRKHIMEWNEEHGSNDTLDENFAINQEMGLYIDLAAYDNISENLNYTEEAELLKSAIIDKVNYLQKFGDIIDFDKLPEKFEQFKSK